MPANYATAITARQYYAIHGNWGDPHHFFEHVAPTGKPASGVDISGLTAGEQASINAWIALVDIGDPAAAPDRTATNVAFSGTANTKVTDLLTYFATAAYKAWRIANIMDRRHQWRWFCADAHDRAEAANPPSSSTTGASSGGGGDHITKTTN